MTVTPDLAVMITCHPDQVSTLPDAMAAVDRQRPAPAERVVVAYGCRPPLADPQGPWRVVRGDPAHPAGALNDAWTATRSPWAMVIEARTVLPPGSLAATAAAIARCPATTAVLYRDEPRRTGVELTAGADYWALRLGDHLHHGATWRRRAVDLVGGWPTRCRRLLGHALALDVTAAGWAATRIDGPPAPAPADPAGATPPVAGADDTLAEDRWQARSLAIVSLHAGRTTTLPVWKRFLMTADLPARTSLYVVDNSADRGFTERLEAACSQVADARRLAHVDLSVDATPHRPEPDESYLARGRNLHVARLYAAALPRAREDLVLTLEDDIDPPPSAVRQLGHAITAPSTRPTGTVSAAWDRVAGPNVCAGRDDGSGWGSAIPWGELPRRPMDVGSVGGACTMWANSALSQGPVDIDWDRQMGWDALLCADMRRRGFGVQVHGGVRCLHHTGGVLRSTLEPRRPHPGLAGHPRA